METMEFVFLGIFLCAEAMRPLRLKQVTLSFALCRACASSPVMWCCALEFHTMVPEVAGSKTTSQFSGFRVFQVALWWFASLLA
jgi:hypothetical protein